MQQDPLLQSNIYIPCICQKTRIGIRITSIGGAVIHRVVSDQLHVLGTDLADLVPGHQIFHKIFGRQYLANLVPSHVLHDVAPVVLRVHAPVHLN